VESVGGLRLGADRRLVDVVVLQQLTPAVVERPVAVLTYGLQRAGRTYRFRRYRREWASRGRRRVRSSAGADRVNSARDVRDPSTADRSWRDTHGYIQARRTRSERRRCGRAGLRPLRLALCRRWVSRADRAVPVSPPRRTPEGVAPDLTVGAGRKSRNSEDEGVTRPLRVRAGPS